MTECLKNNTTHSFGGEVKGPSALILHGTTAGPLVPLLVPTSSLVSMNPFTILAADKLSLWIESSLRVQPASWEIYMRVKKQQLEPNMEQQTGSKLGKECVKAVL